MKRKKPNLMDLWIAPGARRAGKRRGLENPAQHARHTGSYVDNGIEFALGPDECAALDPCSGAFDLGFYSLVNWVARKDFNRDRLRKTYAKGGRARARRLAPALRLRRLDIRDAYERLRSGVPSRVSDFTLRKRLAARFGVSVGTVWLDLRAARRGSLK